MNQFGATGRRRKPRELCELSKLERALLQHVERYRLTTRSAWRGIWELSGFGHEQLARAVRRLTTWEILRRNFLFGSTHGFELGGHGAAMLGLPADRSLPLTASARFSAYANLLFATSRRLVLANRDDLPVLDETGLPACGMARGHFFDPQDRSRWFRLMVDKQLHTSPNRVAIQTWRSIQSSALWKVGRCQSPVAHLTYVVITPSRRRAERICNRLRRFRDSPIPKVELLVAPDLIPLIDRQRPSR